MNKLEELFTELWENGTRFLTEEEMNNHENMLYKENEGHIDGFTINGLKKLAENGNLTLGKDKLTPEHVEIMFSYIKFMHNIGIKS